MILQQLEHAAARVIEGQRQALLEDYSRMRPSTFIEYIAHPDDIGASNTATVELAAFVDPVRVLFDPEASATDAAAMLRMIAAQIEAAGRLYPEWAAESVKAAPRGERCPF